MVSSFILTMVEVSIDSIRVSLMSQHRVVILKDIDSDRYFPLDGQREIAARLRRSVHGPEPFLIRSEYGHDAFLIEHAIVADALRTLLDA